MAVEFLANHNAAHRKFLPILDIPGRAAEATSVRQREVAPVPPYTRSPRASRGHKATLPLTLPVTAERLAQPVPWRGHGGRHPTPSSVEFDRQLDKVSIWLEAWDHDTRCQVLEAILRRSNYNQCQFLFTVTQPSLHRDFMYTATPRFPGIEFKPVSTHASRELKEKLSRLRLDTFHRVKSAYLQEQEVSTSLPPVDNNDPHSTELKHGCGGANTARPCWTRSTRHGKSRANSKGRLGLAKSLTSLTSSLQSLGSDSFLLDRGHSEFSRSTQSIPVTQDAVDRFVDMPVRRHIQDEMSSQKSQPQPDIESRVPAKGSVVLSPPEIVHHEMKRMKTFDSPGYWSRNQIQYCDLNSLAGSDQNLSVRQIRQLPKEARLLIHWYTQSWNDTKKNEFFHKLLLKLDLRQQYFISSFVSKMHHRDFITQLPEKIALQILSYLSPKELVDISRVSKAWQKLANHNSLWEAKCREVKLEVPVSDNPLWKQVFKDNLYLRLNWNRGICRVTDFKGHTLSVLTVTFDKDRLASGSADKTIRVWDIKTGQTLHVLKGHTKGIWCLRFFTRHLLVSGSYDSTIKVWNLRTGTTCRTLLGHSGPVWCMILRGNTLVSGSQDKTAKIWDINRCLLLKTLSGHNAAVFAVDMNLSCSLILTGSADRTVRMWAPESGKCKRVISVSQTTSIMAVSYSQGYFACSYGNTICLYNGTKLIRTYNEHKKRVETLELRIANAETGEGMIVSGGQDGLCKYWDISKTESIQTFEGHNQMVNCIHFDELRIATASFDNKIRMWDFNI